LNTLIINIDQKNVTLTQVTFL